MRSASVSSAVKFAIGVTLVTVCVQGSVQAQRITGNDGGVRVAAVAALKVAYRIPDSPRIQKRTAVTKLAWLQDYDLGLGANATITSYRKRGPYEMTFFVASDEDTVFVAFRGSETKANWALNGMPWKGGYEKGEYDGFVKWDGKEVNFRTIDSAVGSFFRAVPGALKDSKFLLNAKPTRDANYRNTYVHRGWATGVNTVWSDVKTALQAHNAQNKRIIVAGHSLGGALSGYLTFRLLNQTTFFNPDKSHRLVTFGAPHYSLSHKGVDFSHNLLHLIESKAPKLRVYAVETKGPYGYDYVTISWDLMGVRNSIETLAKEAASSGNSKFLKDAATFFAKELDSLVGQATGKARQEFGTAYRVGSLITIETKRYKFSKLHDNDDAYYPAINDWRPTKKAYGWPTEDEDPKLVAGVGYFPNSRMTYTFYNRPPAQRHPQWNLITTGSISHLGSIVPGPEPANMGMWTILPGDYKASQIVGVATPVDGAGTRVMIYFADGKRSVSDYQTDFRKFNVNPSIGRRILTYNVPNGYQRTDIVGICFRDKKDGFKSYTFYRNGKMSIGNGGDLAKFSKPRAFKMPAAYSAKRIVGVAWKDNLFYAYYDDGNYSAGSDPHNLSLNYSYRPYRCGPMMWVPYGALLTAKD